MTNITSILSDKAEHILSYQCTGISSETLHLPGPDYVDLEEGIQLLHAIQDVYLSDDVTIA